MAQKTLVTQGELKAIISGLNALAENLDEHVNQSLSKAHGWSVIDTPYLDAGGLYHTDFGQTGLASIPGLLSTGVNADGTLASPGSVDTHWTLVQSADTTAPGPSAFVSSPTISQWSTDGPKSQWISPKADGTKSLKGGTYKYRISFNLTGFNPASAVIRGSWVSDNNTTSVILNGVVTGFVGPSNSNKQPSLGTSFVLNGGFIAGVNTLDFLVNNSGGPTGLRVELSGVASAGGVFIVPSIFNTGVTGGGSLATQGTTDAHWSMIQSADPSNPGPAAVVISKLDSTWAPNTTISQWIGPKANESQNNTPIGDYVYRLTFDLTGFIATTAIIRGAFVSDDITTEVLLNGQVTGVTNTTTHVANTKKYTTSFVITSGFQTGSNTLDFHVHNQGGNTGLRVELTGTASHTGGGFTSRVIRLDIGGNVFYVPAQVSGGMDAVPDPVIPSFTGIVSPQSADPASDLTVGSPTSSELVTTFEELLNSISTSASDTLLQHAGSPAETVHSGLSWQTDSVFSTAGYLVGRRTINITINGVHYKIVGDYNPNGPIV